ncbi:MAG: integrase, partial [Planctomycetes bacterium]|nr:integrase [Planctomycetota bacterium]
MASISTDKSGRRRLQFTDPNGRRHTVRLGKIPKRTAEAIKTRVEHLLTAQISKQPIDVETS